MALKQMVWISYRDRNQNEGKDPVKELKMTINEVEGKSGSRMSWRASEENGLA